MMKKKVFYPILFTCLLLSLAACSSETADVPKEDKAPQKVQEEKQTTEVEPAHWSYEGETGPEYWGDLDPTNAVCTNGEEQSPINIETAKTEKDDVVEELNFNYTPTNFSLANNGHTIQGNPTAIDNSIVVDGEEYKLAQFHFHTPSEHEFNGQSFDMELHLVHKSANNELAVIGLMIKEGVDNTALEQAWNVLPKEVTTKDVKVTEAIDLMGLLPENKQTFRYEGSLTTPPCSEEVEWIVLEQPIEMSKEQIDLFRQIFEDNHRPVQPLNDREIDIEPSL
ncbi:carbonic anhydrase family protein [Sporosarcina sp. ANT_H38]|uniref:carbonic anhydrase n=1 Tax=Sporosarcina sp. ANT_H38 TaxID=2597358 RepID=UPI0011F3E683|nr:carbonic anhydrase family protein [Sporosarcina sp. ANT_H38]KAA0965100.1 carbonic anhydrase family protein [Sporosarcina sp. ANT_H38]